MLKKYKYKLRVLLIRTPDYKNKDYLKTKEKYEKNMKIIHKHYIKMLTKIEKNKKFKIYLFGFDGKLKKTYSKLSVRTLISDVKKMPLGHLKRKLKPINQSLYSDYNKLTSNKGFGFSNKEKALDTIKKLKKEKIRYQVYVVTTMLGRAKNHPHQTKGMRDAIKVYKKWLKDYKMNKNKF